MLFGFEYSGDVKLVWFWLLGRCTHGLVLILGRCWFSLVETLGRRNRWLGFGVLGRRWFSLVFALGRRKIHHRHLTSPESRQRLPSQTIRLPS